MDKIISLEEYERKDTFLMFHNKDNPFLFLTVKLDITNLINHCEIHKYHYATISYVICKTVNEVDNFKYRLVGGQHIGDFVNKLEKNIEGFNVEGVE